MNGRENELPYRGWWPLAGGVLVGIAETKARRTWSYYFLMPALANILFVLGTLVILIEGWICAILIIPLFALVALDDHVRIGGQYFDLGETQYSLSEMGGQTLLRIRMQYRVSTRFNWYTGPLADLLVGNFADVVLRFYARRAEVEAPPQPLAPS